MAMMNLHLLNVGLYKFIIALILLRSLSTNLHIYFYILYDRVFKI